MQRVWNYPDIFALPGLLPLAHYGETLMTNFDINKLDWEKMNNLIPAIIQDAKTSKVLMLGYMNKESLTKTLSTNIVTFYSRSKKRLWTKGETSSNFLKLCELTYDCDSDSLLLLVNPDGPTCHKEKDSCFENEILSDWEVIKKLEDIIENRIETKPKNSYTARLVAEGTEKVVQKVGEEAVEVVIAALGESKTALTSELADLFFHILVLLQSKKMSISDVIKVLKTRMT